MYLQSQKTYHSHGADPAICAKTGLKPSFCYYKRWGVKKKRGHRQVIPLRFSKSGRPEIERAYATHYVDSKRIEQLKKEEQDGTWTKAKRIHVPAVAYISYAIGGYSGT